MAEVEVYLLPRELLPFVDLLLGLQVTVRVTVWEGEPKGCHLPAMTK